MGFILGVPFVLDFSELLSRVFCTESEMALRVVWLAFCRDGEITIAPIGSYAGTVYLPRTRSQLRGAILDHRLDIPPLSRSMQPSPTQISSSLVHWAETPSTAPTTSL